MTLAQLTFLVRADTRSSKPRKRKVPTTAGTVSDLLALANMQRTG